MEWVNPVYLDISYQEQIQEEFEDSSEIQLKDFLKVIFNFFTLAAGFLHGLLGICLQEEKFRQVNEALRLSQIRWTRKGPPNKRWD